MFNKKLLSVLLIAVMLFSTVAAATFSDVENDPTVSWAKPYITEMSEKGYIKGYEDGTFKPNNPISKTESLILLSRMIGVNDATLADTVAFAKNAYTSVLSKYNTNYAKEVSYLLYMGILDESELDSYISESNKNTPLLRYQAAILLTKLLGAEDEVLSNPFVFSSYADTASIPDSARAYVEYVKEQGIMQGMGNNADGEPEFSPNTNVTRSQMAKMLCTLIDIVNLSAETGTISAIDTFAETMTVTTAGTKEVYNLTDSTKYKVNGKDSSLSAFKKGMTVKTICVADKALLVEKQDIVEDTLIYGLISSTKDTEGTRSVVITDANDSSIKESYVLSDTAKIRVSGAIDLFSKVKSGNYVALTIKDGLVELLEVIDKSATAYGILKSIDFSGDFTVISITDNNGNVEAYEVSSDDVQVSRNSLDASVSDLMIGDSLSIKLTYGKVTKIQASSVSKNNEGTIDYITYRTDGTTIGIKINGEVVDYKVNKSVTVIVDSSDNATVYDLRPGTDVAIKLQSKEIVQIEAASVVAKSQLNGIVKSINATYGLMVVEEGGKEYNVFVNSSTKIIDSVTGRTILLKNVEKNRTASVTGSNSSGVLEASVIVLQ